MRRHPIKMLVCTMIAVPAAFLAPDAISAQSLADRIESAPTDANVVFRFASRPGICGDGDRIVVRHGDGRTSVQRMRGGRSWSRDDYTRDFDMQTCVEGPVEVLLERRDRSITDAELSVGGTPPAGAVDLGTVTAPAAVEWLLSPATLAAHGAADVLVFGATLANAESWPGLLRLAQDRSLDSGPRRTAIFWLSQVAGERATEGLVSVVGNDSDEIEVRKAAVFSLSQQRGDAAIDALIEIARTNQEPEIRRNAMFWLGQTASPKAIAFFREVLGG